MKLSDSYQSWIPSVIPNIKADKKKIKGALTVIFLEKKKT